MEKYDFEYEPMRPDEQRLGMILTMGILQDEEIMGQVADFHKSGDRCAMVIILKDGEFENGYVGNEEAIQDRFPFPQVLESLALYEPGENICLIFQRENLISAGIVGGNVEPPMALRS